MGQRLVVTVQDGDERIATAYFHWSAYTKPALLVTRGMMDVISDYKDIDDHDGLRLELIKWAYRRGGGIDSVDLDECRKRFPNESFPSSGYSRNEGLIAISENGMHLMEAWSEGSVVIDIEARMIFFDVFNYYASSEECLQYMDESNKCVVSDKVINTEISFDDFLDGIDSIYDLEFDTDAIFRTTDGCYVTFIE